MSCSQSGQRETKQGFWTGGNHFILTLNPQILSGFLDTIHIIYFWGGGVINEFGGLDLLNRYAVVIYAVQLLFMGEENSN